MGGFCCQMIPCIVSGVILKKEMKMTDLEYIKKFSKIKIAKICRENGVNSSNLWSGRLSDEKIHLIRKAIEKEVGTIYVEEYQRTK